MHVYVASGDPYATIKQAVLFAGYAVGAPSGGSSFLSGSQLAGMAQAIPGSGQPRSS
jgi:hypothetical protein